jgi:hypothetical protein
LPPVAYHVLVVDGKSGLSQAAASYGRPIQLEHAPSQAWALDRLGELPTPDAVVLDQRVGDADARAMSEAVAADPRLDGIRLVLLGPDVEAFLSAPLSPFDAYLIERDPERGLTLALAAVML